jgi:transposase InsO family protein
VDLADDSLRAAHRRLSDYFEFSNHRRLHQALTYRTPAEVYATPPSLLTNQPIIPTI